MARQNTIRLRGFVAWAAMLEGGLDGPPEECRPVRAFATNTSGPCLLAALRQGQAPADVPIAWFAARKAKYLP